MEAAVVRLSEALLGQDVSGYGSCPGGLLAEKQAPYETGDHRFVASAMAELTGHTG